MTTCTYSFTGADGKPTVITGKAAFKSYLLDGGLLHLLSGAQRGEAVPRLEPEDVLTPETVAKAKIAIKRYKRDEPPDPLTKKQRAEGERLLAPMFEAAHKNKTDFDAMLDRIGETVGGYAKKPSVKKPYRAVTKLVMENKWRIDAMKDLLRGTIAVSTFKEAQDAINEIAKVYTFDRIKNRLAADMTSPEGETIKGKPLVTGYQDILTNVILPDGTVAEIQISTPEMLAAKNLGHEIYAFEREMPNSPVKADMIALQKKIYAEGYGSYEGRAAKAANTRSNSALSILSAFSRTSEGLRGSASGTQAVAERQSGETVTGTSFQSKNMVPGGKDLKSNFIVTSKSIISNSRGAQKNPAASRVNTTSASRFERTEALKQAVSDLQEGKIKQDEYNRMVDELRPVYPYETLPAITTKKNAVYALGHGKGQSPEKAAKYGLPSKELKAGDFAQLRLDIPSYQQHDAWVVSVHTPKSTNTAVQAAYDAGPVVGYESAAALTDASFGMNQKAAAKIATGTSKGTIATVFGKWKPISAAAAKVRADAAIKDPAWTQVGMDPFRHSYFYDRDTMRPVLTADEVIQIGPLVLAKNATFSEDNKDITGSPILFSKQRQTDTPNFKRWFGDSKVVDENGEPLVVYHGSSEKGIAIFESEDGRFYFTDSKKVANGYGRKSGERKNAETYDVYLRMEKPDVYDMGGASWYDDGVGTEVYGYIMDAKEGGYDGIILENFVDGASKKGAKPSTIYVVFEPTQIKSATSNNGEYSLTNPNITKSVRRPEFFSQLQRSIEEVPDRLATQPAQQWKAWLASNAPKLGIKKDEIEWSGINDYLDLQGKAKLSKDDLATYLEEGGVRVEETLLGETGLDNPGEMSVDEANDYGDEFAVFDEEGRVIGGTYPTREEAENAMAEMTANMPSKYGKYTLPGGENYRELLLMLPQETNRIGQLVLKAQTEILNSAETTEFQKLMQAGETAMPPKFNYKSSHWDQRNVIAHIRVNDRVDADGNKVLFVEEVQSDWGQEGKKRGFQGGNPFTVRPDSSGVEALANRWEVVDQDGNIEEGFRTEAEAQRWADLEGQGKGVPMAPFVTKTEGWLNLALKRITMMAVEGGYDKVAFVNGQQSADRYDLSKTVGAIEAHQYKDGFGLDVEGLNGERLAERMFKSKTDPAIADFVGKEIAEKIASRGEARLTDLDLKVGGEGMIKFYDQIVPQAINKLLPKLGGEKLGSVKIATTEGRDLEPASGEDVMDSLGIPEENRREYWANLSQTERNKLFEKFRNRDLKPTPQPGFDVTDKMRDTVSEGVPLFSKQRIVGESNRQYTPEQLAMFKNTGRTVDVPTIKERILELRKDLGKKLAQGLADQFMPLRELGNKAYTLARLSRGSAGAFEALLHHGKLSIRDGAFDADQSGGFIERVGIPLHGELEDFMWWIAANRAERLTKEDRENLFTPEDIAAGKSLSSGTTNYDYTLQHDAPGNPAGTVTRDRALIYGDALKSFDEFNKNALDMAEQSGLIDPDSRKFWENEFYVPFYRVSDEDGAFMGAKMGNQLVRQRAFKRLKGGTDKLNSDLLANTLQNWGHLIDASAKNRAAKASLEAAEKMGVAIEASATTVQAMSKAIGKKGSTVWFMDGGKERHFLVDDPYVLAAISSLEFSGMRGPIMEALSLPKHWLTVGVTASPAFKIRNLVRDSVQAVATAPLSYNIATNIKEGVKASNRSSQTYASALASGGLIRFGTMLEGSQSKRVRQLVKMGVKDSTILDSESKVAAMYGRYIEPGIMAYNELGNRGEEINRASLYKQLTDQGMDHAEAALLARDLMDFSMQGSWTSVRFLTQVVPFMNARIQGLYKLGRAANDDPKRFGVVLGAVALASIALMLAYKDDDDWKKREDWDRNSFWWFKVGGVAFRIPKPFEVGAIGTLAERGLEYFVSKEMTGKRLGKNVYSLIMDNLSMNPVPQAVKPIVDLYANKDSFTGRPIETMGMEKLKPQYRYTQSTSMVARGLSTGTFGALSPVQFDHVMRGYFGWLGSFVVGGADMIIRPLTGEATRPTADYWKMATQGIAQETTSGSSRYVTQMYDQAKELEEAYGTYRSLMKQGRYAEASAFQKENKEELAKYRSVEHVKRSEARFNERIRMIERSNLDPDVKKEQILQIQKLKDRTARMVAPGYQNP